VIPNVGHLCEVLSNRGVLAQLRSGHRCSSQDGRRRNPSLKPSACAGGLILAVMAERRCVYAQRAKTNPSQGARPCARCLHVVFHAIFCKYRSFRCLDTECSLSTGASGLTCSVGSLIYNAALDGTQEYESRARVNLTASSIAARARFVYCSFRTVAAGITLRQTFSEVILWTGRN
jgi:hypothetical protein